MTRSYSPIATPAGASQKRLIAIAAGLILACAASRLWLLPIHFSTDPNEGWNAYQALRAMGDTMLYPAPGSLIANNYPPLSFLAVDLVGLLIGDPIIAGRMIALGSVMGIAGLLFAILRRLGGRGPVPAIGALLFLALNATILREYVALDDPQWLGHLFMTAGLLVLLPRDAGKAPRVAQVILAALLMLLGGFTKQNLIGWPIAVTLWLGWHHRDLLPWWIGAGLLGIAAALIACRVAFGPDFLADVLGTARIFSIDRIVHRAGGAVLVMAALIWWTWPILRRRPSDLRFDVVRLAVLVTVPLGIIERGGAGVHLNAHFEAAIALSLGAALAFEERFSARVDRIMAGLAMSALFAAGFLFEAREVRRFSERQAAWEAMEQRIALVPGAVACESQALCFWAGQPFGIDFFLYSQRARKTGDTRAIDRALAAQRFAAVQIDANPPPGNPDRATDPILRRLAATMHPVFIDASGRSLLMHRQ